MPDTARLPAWTFEPAVVVALAAGALLYGLGVRHLWRSAGRGRGVTSRQITAFAMSVLAIGVALLSPLDALGDALFSAHMAQHLLLILVAAPLIVVANGPLVTFWALPRVTRVAVGRWWMTSPRMHAAISILTLPASAWLLHLTTLFFWHVPAAYGWALGNEAIHALEHVSFLGAAVLFWWVALAPLGHRLGAGSAMLYVASAGVLMGGLGAVLTFATTPWYVGHLGRTELWHLSPLADQQLAGAMMWVPAGFVYLGVAGALCIRWLQDDAAAMRPATPAP